MFSPKPCITLKLFCNQNKVASVIQWRWRRKRGSLLQAKMSGLSSCISALATRIAAAGPPTGKPHQPNLFGNNRSYPGIREVTYDPKQVVVPRFLPDSPESRAELAEYYQSVSRLDQGVGRLMEVLKETGQYANTLIVYSSDNGIAFPGTRPTSRSRNAPAVAGS